MANSAKVADQLSVIQEAKIRWSELALPIKGRFDLSDHESGARAAAFNAEKQRFCLRALAFCHRPKYFRVGRICKANGAARPLAAASSFKHSAGGSAWIRAYTGTRLVTVRHRFVERLTG